MAKINNVTVKILMLGGRRCGKTSVLASMQDCFDREFGSGNLTITIDDPATMLDLTEKMSEIKNFYVGDHSQVFSPDDNPTSEIRRYDLSISLKSKHNGKINFQFIDYPGEWVQNLAHLKELKDLISESHVFLIAIDTPHLMEQASDDEPGRYNEFHNRSDMICKMLIKELDSDEEKGKKDDIGKLILFVPLKCEKYKNANQMDQVKKKIRKAYQPLIQHLNNPHTMIQCTMAISPVYTFGTVEFKRFLRDHTTQEILLDEQYKTPKYPLYGFMENSTSVPEPKYCEQPMLYILAFMFAAAQRAKEGKKLKGPFWDLRSAIMTLCANLFNMPSAEDYMTEVKNLKNRMCKDDGYEIITDPLSITKNS